MAALAKEIIARNPFHTYAVIVRGQHESGIVDVNIDENDPAEMYFLRKSFVSYIRVKYVAGWGLLRGQDPANRGLIENAIGYCRTVVQFAEHYLETNPPPDALDLLFVLEVLILCKLLTKGISSDNDLVEMRVSVV